MPICLVYLRGCVVAKSPKKKGPETGPWEIVMEQTSSRSALPAHRKLL